MPHQVPGTGLPAAQNKVQIKHLANICIVSRAIRFIHLLTKVHNCSWENKSIQFHKHLSSSSLIQESLGGKNHAPGYGSRFLKKSRNMLFPPLSHQKQIIRKKSNQLPKSSAQQHFISQNVTSPRHASQLFFCGWKRIPYLSGKIAIMFVV